MKKSSSSRRWYGVRLAAHATMEAALSYFIQSGILHCIDVCADQGQQKSRRIHRRGNLQSRRCTAHCGGHSVSCRNCDCCGIMTDHHDHVRSSEKYRRSGLQRPKRHLDAAAGRQANTKARHRVWRRQAHHHPPGNCSSFRTGQHHKLGFQGVQCWPGIIRHACRMDRPAQLPDIDNFVQHLNIRALCCAARSCWWRCSRRAS